MTKKDYILIADCLIKAKNEGNGLTIDFWRLVNDLEFELKVDNNNFDADRFHDYINK